jgi:hypothetical protein
MKTRAGYQSADHGAAGIRDRHWDRLMACALSASLDRQLAAGRPPQSSHALALRARRVISVAERRKLARCWIKVLEQAHRHPVPRSPRAPLRRTAVLAARPDLQAMISILDSGLPIDARGAAMAGSLLRDGTGPLYNHRSPVELGTVIREATNAMAASPLRAQSLSADWSR